MTAEECRTLKNHSTLVTYTRRPAKSINRSPHAVEREMTVFISKQKKFPAHFEGWEKPALPLPRAGIQFNLWVPVICFEILPLCDTALISHHTTWGWAVTQPEPMAMLWHHNPTIQGCFLQGMKAQRAPPAHPHRILLPQGPRGHCPSHSHHRLHGGVGQQLLHVGMCLQGEDRASQKFKEQHKGTVAKHLNSKSLLRQGNSTEASVAGSGQASHNTSIYLWGRALSLTKSSFLSVAAEAKLPKEK